MVLFTAAVLLGLRTDKRPRAWTARIASESRDVIGRSGWRDLNPRPPAPKAGALPSCATPRGRPSLGGSTLRADGHWGWVLRIEGRAAVRPRINGGTSPGGRPTGARRQRAPRTHQSWTPAEGRRQRRGSRSGRGRE